MTRPFAPIAIVGRACVLPGALDPAAFASLALEGRDAITPAPDDRWGVARHRVMGHGDDRAWSDRGGYVTGFDARFDASGFGLDAGAVEALDPLFQWTLHVARECLRDAKVDAHTTRTGAILGNLSFPTAAMARYAEHVWLDATPVAPRTLAPDARNRFMSGLPALLLGPALGLTGPRHCLDAACASSLYAIALACDALHDGSADVMLAGAVNCADDLFIHVGFCALSAMSRTGRSRPFHAEADGLVPAEGCAMVALMRLDDALAKGHRVLGVVRGVGLSNDGRARGLLAPSEHGQVRAMRAAWERAGLSPDTAQYVECHATGTPVGDATELRSLREVFGARALPIGSFKANVGHLVTVAGAAGLLKVLAGFEADAIPPTPHVEKPIEGLDGAALRVVHTREPWARGDTPRRAAVSAFGFGGNNAHLVVEEYIGQRITLPAIATAPSRVAVVSVGARVGDGDSAATFAHDLFHGRSRVRPRPDGTPSAHADDVRLTLAGLKFPPTDLERAIAQQTMMLAAAREALDAVGDALPRERTGVLVGMGCDAEVARWGARWRLAEEADRLGADVRWTAAARDAVAPALDAATVLGTMPNIPANRVHSQFDLGGAGFTVSAEEGSGHVALAIAARALRERTLDAAVVGATEACAEPVHERALRTLTGDARPTGDAAVALVLMREDDARTRGLPVLCVLDDDATPTRTLGDDATELTPLFGRPHAAIGLLHVAAGALALHHGADIALTPRAAPAPWPAPRAVRITTRALTDVTHTVTLAAAHDDAAPLPAPTATTAPTLRLRAHFAKPVLAPLPSAAPHAETMPPAPTLPSILDLPRVDDEPAPALAPTPAPAAPTLRPSPAPQPTAVTTDVLARVANFQRDLGALHQRFIADQAALHQRFLDVRAKSLSLLLSSTPHPPLPRVEAPHPPLPRAPSPPIAGKGLSETKPQGDARSVVRNVPTPAGDGAPSLQSAGKGRAAAGNGAPSRRTARGAGLTPNLTPPKPRGLTLSREQLKVHAGGRISEVFGPLFAQQDGYAVQVRMPMEPMLLADRATGIDATPGVLGRGTTWTETDLRWDAWYMHDGRMPAGVMIETGQADLLLVSYMGIDFLNRGERCYRLLGCELTYHRSPPRAGETIDYDIHIDGHANQGDVRLMFFHYDCRADGAPALTVRNGQAGFFTTKELDDSAGILWRAETQPIEALTRDGGEARVDAPTRLTTKRAFTSEEIRAFAAGDAFACFGPGFERARTHNRTPRIAAGRLTFIDRVTDIAPDGGPWKRGYLRAETTVHPDDWYFPGHFHNDPCMPGTLMFEACLQTMAFYLAALGYTLQRDGWRFEPVTGETYKLLCRGQVTPKSRALVYEVFVEELHGGPIPTLFADLLCTVDGLGAFHARRVGLRLVPDWPLTSHARIFPADALAPPPGSEPASLPQCDPSKPVAVVKNGPSAGFKLDYASLVACAWGRPSTAFGPIYERFDGTRRVARLPGPPYHFMSRIAEVEGAMGEAKAGARVVVDYDVPKDAWYFARNGHATMPMSVLMEAALQPCGWLASYVGCTLLPDEDVLFRNLDGKGTLLAEVLPTSGTLRTEAKLTNVSRSGTMIIVSFAVRCAVGDTPVYTLDTVFGFFPPSAFEDQPGLPTTPEQRALYDAPTAHPIDLAPRPARLCTGTARLADAFLLMIDRVTHFDPRGGRHGLGALRAEKDVDPGAWFFKAHFFQDPVQPGSLGIEAMCQLLQLYMLEVGMHEGLRAPRFEPIAAGRALVWKYRGQVVPENRVIGCTLEVSATGRDERGVFAVADASLWVDGKRIYDAKGLAMRIVEGAAPDEETLDPTKEPWLADHAPTWVIPALPAMSMLDRMAGAVAQRSGRDVVSVDALRIARWITLTAPTRLRTVATTQDGARWEAALEVFREARDPRLSRFEPVATCTVTVGTFPAPPTPLPPLDAPEVPDPYASGQLFHGPAFRLLRTLRMGAHGSSATLTARADAPFGYANQVLLDAATHGVPHDAMERWSSELPASRAAYPHVLEDVRFYGPAPRDGDVRVEARFVSWDGTHARTRLQLIADGRVWSELTLAEVLMPKGPIGVASPASRVAFLRDRRYVAGVALSRADGDATVLDMADVAASNWLPGTVERVYGLQAGDDVAASVAVRDHVARATATHPSRVRIEGGDAYSLHEPFNKRPFAVQRDGATVTVRDAGASSLTMATVRDFWRARMKTGPWPGEDVFLGLIERFIRRVHVADPDAMDALRGKGVLYLGNHQVGVESLLFGVAVSALNGVATLTLAKGEHRGSWVGRLLNLGFSYPGLDAPRVISYFDRDNPASLPGVLNDLGVEMQSVGSNVMIHVEGTRSLSCRERVVKMTGAILDMAIALGVSVVPVRFVGGLPVEPLTERIEFPVGMGRQDVHLGAPISPETLASMPYKARKDLVIGAINGLGPGDTPEAPLPGDPTLAAEVAAWEAQTGAEPPYATMFCVMRRLPSPSQEIAAVVDAARTGALVLDDTPQHRWLAELAQTLYGPRGPRVVLARGGA